MGHDPGRHTGHVAAEPAFLLETAAEGVAIEERASLSPEAYKVLRKHGTLLSLSFVLGLFFGPAQAAAIPAIVHPRARGRSRV